MTAARSTAPMQSVYDGQECVGFILSRGRAGFEGYDADLNSLGLFHDQDKAAAALLERVRP